MFPEKLRKNRKLVYRVMAVLFWIAIWHILSMQKILGIFLASPWQTVCRFAELCGTLAFWRSLLYTSGRILAGFLLAAAVGTLLASLTGKSPLLDVFLMPVMRLVRTVPVVSFIILALILVSSKYLTQLIAFIMALPIIYMNVRTGIATTDRKLTEMAGLFKVPALRKIRYLYVPQVMPAFETGTTLALGFAWKSGIAAEVIGMPAGSVGEMMQRAKVYLDTPDLFAWTLAVVLLSIAAEKVWKRLLSLGGKSAVL